MPTSRKKRDRVADEEAFFALAARLAGFDFISFRSFPSEMRPVIYLAALNHLRHESDKLQLDKLSPEQVEVSFASLVAFTSIIEMGKRLDRIEPRKKTRVAGGEVFALAKRLAALNPDFFSFLSPEKRLSLYSNALGRLHLEYEKFDYAQEPEDFTLTCFVAFALIVEMDSLLRSVAKKKKWRSPVQPSQAK
jgi:hypothetical protein